MLHHLFVADHRQPPARSLSLFLRVRSRFLNYYPDVYRYTSFFTLSNFFYSFMNIEIYTSLYFTFIILIFN